MIKNFNYLLKFFKAYNLFLKSAARSKSSLEAAYPISQQILTASPTQTQLKHVKFQILKERFI